VSWLYEGCFDVEDVDFVEHGLYQPFNGVFSSAIGTETRHTEGTGCGREDKVAAVVLGTEVWEGELNDVEGAEEVGAELIAEVIVVLVLAGTYNTY
jgi:hypothetical protein